MKLIAKGAEAEIYEDGEKILKRRISKKYRIPEIDSKLISSRTKREAKLLEKLKVLGANVPEVLKMDGSDLEIEKIGGQTLRQCLDKTNYGDLMGKAGEQIAILHRNDIFHGDLTTSNMINREGKVFLIDFGLASVSTRVEDKAVDLHVFKQALEATHNEIWKKAEGIAFESYAKNYPGANEVFARLGKVESRGRNKGKSSG